MTNWRVWGIGSLISILFLVIIIRVFYLQVLKGDFFLALSEGRENNFLTKERGKIFFRNGEELATNIYSTFLLVDNLKIKKSPEIIKKLSEILKIDENFIKEIFASRKRFLVLKKRLSNEEVEKIKNLKIEGIYLEDERIRYYPYQKIAGQVVGFVNANGVGQYGLEEYYEKELKEGEDIFTTLDLNIQIKCEALLEKAKEKLNIEGGQIIVLNPENGEVLAMANYPFFNPNDFSNVENLEIALNGATQKLFEPGSLFKLITMGAAIEEGKISPQTTYLDEGFVKIGGWTIKNFENRIWGKRTMTEVLEWSINTGAVFVEKQLGHELFLKYLEKFKIFEKTGIDLPEIYSENREFKKGYEVNFATASFGQGIELTPIQLLRAIAVFANQGKLITPHLNKNFVFKKEEIISQKTSKTLTEMAVSVVENGYGRSAKVKGYFIAGKTGTSQIPWSYLGIKKKGYSDKTWQSFVGWFPAFSPRFLILVKLDNPTAKAAGVSTTLIAKELIEFLLTYSQITPDFSLK